MKTRRLSTIMMSAYLSAMLASSLAPMAGNIALAGTVNPSAAEAAFRQALIGAGTMGWTSTSDIPVPPMVTAQISPANVKPADPILSETALARLLKLISEQPKPSTIPAGVCAHFKLCDGTAKFPVRLIQTDNHKGNFMGQPWEGNPTTIIFARRMPDTTVHFFLTDKSLKPQAAVSSINGVVTVLDLAASKPTYETILSVFAQAVPAEGQTVASN